MNVIILKDDTNDDSLKESSFTQKDTLTISRIDWHIFDDKFSVLYFRYPSPGVETKLAPPFKTMITGKIVISIRNIDNSIFRNKITVVKVSESNQI